jgi:hypothetical protein
VLVFWCQIMNRQMCRKRKVLAQPASANGEFRHVEWDGWGWAGQDTTVYLVFDPMALHGRGEFPVGHGTFPRPARHSLSCCMIWRKTQIKSDADDNGEP